MLRSRAALGARDSKPIRFDFIGRSRWFFSTSGLILLICAIALSVQGLNFGIDFEGGTRITAPLAKAASVDQVRDALPADLQDADIQQVEEPELGETVFQINTGTLQPGQHGPARQALCEKAPRRYSCTACSGTRNDRPTRTAVRSPPCTSR